jgi:hypothetical protein
MIYKEKGKEEYTFREEELGWCEDGVLLIIIP